MMWRADEATVRRRAAYEDEGQRATSFIVLSVVVASLAAIVIALKEAKAAGAHVSNAPPWAWISSVSTLVLGWLVVQKVFALHYAHRYFGDGDTNGVIDRGAEFPGDAPNSYRDFIYMAVCIGASA